MILYFTGSGNSRYAAETIGAAAGDAVISMKDWIKTGKPSSFQFDTPYDFICMTIPFAELKAQNGMKPLRRGADYSFLLH